MKRALVGTFLRRTQFLFAGLLIFALSVPPATAQDSAPAAEPPPKVQELLQLLDDPAVRDWLAQRQAATSSAPQAAPAEAPAMSPSGYFAGRIAAIRQHVAGLAAAIPKLPDEFERAGIILSLEFEERGLFMMLLLLAVFVGLGFGAEQLYHWIAKGAFAYIIALPLDTVAQRLRAVAIRLAYGLGMVGSFAVGSVGAFLALDWPPLLREIVLGYLMAFLVVRLVLVAARFLLAPGGERFRILPMSTPAAWFWTWRLGLFIGWLAFGWVTVGLLGTLGMAPDARRVIAYTLGLVLLVIAVESAWRRPVDPPAMRSRAATWLMTVYCVLLWLLWVASAMPTFWFLLVAAGLPAALRLVQRAVDHLLRPPGAAAQAEATPGVIAASLARGLRALLIIGAALLLAWAWGIDLGELTARDTAGTRLLRGALNVVVIVLVADFLWHVLKALIDRKLSDARAPGQPDTEDARRHARLRTLLPIVRNVLFVVLLVMTLLMALSSLGIEIGPLIAGAGVVGVAIGFGAQTLVKDIISGMFFLLDDAFRVGEYIQSGSYKGTVESFSIRSVKLRHHRGPLYTVPFGELGAVQNMSRDWVIDKLMIGVTYDTDLDKAKKLIKQIGKQLAADPEFAPSIIETLKMQGVEQFGDYAIQIRMKMMTRPGEQFTIRRKAYAMIKKAFDENGINFASPTVQVSGGDDATAAAAQKAIEASRPKPAA
jgi:moderate conductance mechanosensitive channel